MMELFSPSNKLPTYGGGRPRSNSPFIKLDKELRPKTSPKTSHILGFNTSTIDTS